MSRIRYSLNHVGIFVIDIDRMTDFYTSFFGFVVTDERTDINPIRFMTMSENEHHQLLLVAGRLPENPTTVAQISFLLDDFASLRAVHERVVADERITKMWSTDHGNSWTVYFHDPEGNTIECYVHSPWHVAQPNGTPIDWTLPDDEIQSRTEAGARAKPTFMLADAYREQLAGRLAGSSK